MELRNFTNNAIYLELCATGLGGLGLLGWRRKRKAQAVA
jgi:LPXTG-motif cell wall-anchored protein